MSVNTITHQFYIFENIAQKSLIVAQSVATRIAPFRSDITRRKKSGQALNATSNIKKNAIVKKRFEFS